MLVTLLLGLLSGAAAYANLLAAPSSGAKPNSPFASAPSELVIHATGLDEAAIPSSLNVVASPRALPKPANGGSPSDPLGLWDSAKRPEGPRGPSVFKLNQGRAIDVLRSDYPRLFDRKPDLSIFTKDVQLHDPSGKRLSGLRQYDRVFDMLRFLRSSCMQDAEITYRLVVDHDEKARAPPDPCGAAKPPHRAGNARRMTCPLMMGGLSAVCCRRSRCAGPPSCGCATRRSD